MTRRPPTPTRWAVAVMLVAVPLVSVASLVHLLRTGSGSTGLQPGPEAPDDAALARLLGSDAQAPAMEALRPKNFGAHRAVPGSPDGFLCPGPEPENPLIGHLLEDRLIESPPGTPSTIWSSNVSAVTVYDHDMLRLCTFSNICWDSEQDRVLFLAATVDEARLVAADLEACRTSPAFDWCKCVMGATDSAVAVGGLPCHRLSDVSTYERVNPVVWFLDHYVSSHHFGHWQQTVAILFAALRREDYYQLGRLTQVFVPRMRPPVKEPEAFYLELALSVLSYRTDGILWGHEEDGATVSGFCFHTAHTSSITGRMAMTAEDAWALRFRAYERLSIPLRTCPGRTTVVILRGEDVAVANRQRLLLNIDAILERLRYRGLTNVVITTITDRNSTAEQSCLFAKAGIVISVHSSQLVNMVFALPGSAVIELTVGVQPFDFAETADLLGIHHQMVFTGQTPEMESTPEFVRDCHAVLHECLGQRHHDCLEPKFQTDPTCQSADYRQFSKDQKNADFFASIPSGDRSGVACPADLDLALDSAFASLQQACDGHWAGLRLNDD